MKKTKYTKSPKWEEAKEIRIVQSRLKNAPRNVAIYKDMTIDYHPSKWKEIADKYHLTRQRIHDIKAEVQDMIDKGQIDIDLF